MSGKLERAAHSASVVVDNDLEVDGTKSSFKRFGAVFLRNTINFSSPVDYIEHCLKMAFVPQDGLNRLIEPLSFRQVDGRRSKSPSPAEDVYLGSTVERVCRVFPDLRMCSLAPAPKNQLMSPNTLESLDDQGLHQQLFAACCHGNLKTLKQLLSDPRIVSLVNVIDDNGCSYLMWTVASGSTACVSLLIDHQGDINATDRQGRTCLHWACRLGQTEILRLLLRQGIDITKVDSKGQTCVHVAAERRQTDVLTILVKEGGSDVDVKDTDGVTALMLSARHGGSGLVQLLLKVGADPTSSDKQGKSAIHWAAANSNVKCIRVIVDHHKPTLHFTDYFQQTALHIAAAEGNMKVVEYLVKKGIAPSVADAVGLSPLHWAAFSGHLNCVKFFLGVKSVDCLISRTDNYGALAIHYAALKGQESVISALTNKKKQFDCVDQFGFSPLYWSIFGDCLDTVSWLLKSETDTKRQDSKGCTVLHLTAHLGLSDLCQLMISKGADLHAADNSQAIPLLLSSRYGHAETTFDLIQSGSSVIAKDDRQRTAVHLAARAGHADVLRVLLDAGAEAHATDSNGMLAIQYAADSGRTEAIRVLIDYGSNIQVVGQDGRTLLHRAAAGGFTDCCLLLIRRGIPINAVDNTIHKMTALDLAVDGQQKACADFLVSEGARTNGGQFHRAARLVQAWWKFRRYKQRQDISREHAALVLQCAARQLLTGRRVQRLKKLQFSVRSRAASIIQKKWRAYVNEKRRYEANYAALKANLEEERKQALMALKMIREQEHNCCVPPIQIRLPRVAPVRHLACPQRPLNPSYVSVTTTGNYGPVVTLSSKAKKRGNTSPSSFRDVYSKHSEISCRVNLPDISAGRLSNRVRSGEVDQSEKESVTERQPVAVKFSESDIEKKETTGESNESNKQRSEKIGKRRPRGEPVVLNNLASNLERQNKSLLHKIELRDREIQRLREEKRELTILKRFQDRELADVRQKVQTSELQSVRAHSSRFSGHGRPTQLYSSETSMSSGSLLHRAKSVNGSRGSKTRINKDVLVQHQLHIEQYKERCEELRRVVESVKEMQKLLRSQSQSSLGASAMQTSREDLKQQIKNALEEVIRLRSETDALESLARKNQVESSKKDQRLSNLAAVSS